MSLLIRLIVLCFAITIKPALIAADPFSAGGAQQQSFLPVTEAYQPSVQLRDEQLVVQWSISDGYYLYREQFEARAIYGDQSLPLDTIYEEGLHKDDPFFGETEVFYHNTRVIIPDLPANTTLTLQLTAQGCADAGLCYPPHDWFFQIDTGTGNISETAGPDTAETASPLPNFATLMTMLALAALGGVLLNLMPCVFPVLSLKVLSFARSHHGSPLRHGLMYSAGVVLSFALVAALLIALQSAGRAVGWGFQLQSPAFVALLSCLFFLLALNMLGLFHINLPGLNMGSDLASRSGYSGSFFTGVLATVVASPCTAPFMGTAVGFAATQHASVAMLVFISLGAGMALPILLLTRFPGWLRKLPKPGVWMVRLRQLLAFPLLATALWLAWIIGRQTGADGMTTVVGLWLMIGLVVWLWPLGRKGRVTATLVTLATALWLLGNPVLQSPVAGAQLRADAAVSYSPQRLAEYRANGQAVFVNVTADWCITCAANESMVLRGAAFKRGLEENDVVYMVADWTLYDAEITALLSEYRRNGIPLYLVYGRDPARPARVLPQILTTDLVLSALSEVGAGKAPGVSTANTNFR